MIPNYDYRWPPKSNKYIFHDIGSISGRNVFGVWYKSALTNPRDVFNFRPLTFRNLLTGNGRNCFCATCAVFVKTDFMEIILSIIVVKISCRLCIWHWAWSCFVLIRRRLKVYDASSLSQKLHKPHLGWGLLHNCCIFRIVEMLASFLIRIISRNWGCGKNFWRMLPNSPMFAKALKYITVWWGGALPHADFKVHKRRMMKF